MNSIMKFFDNLLLSFTGNSSVAHTEDDSDSIKVLDGGVTFSHLEVEDTFSTASETTTSLEVDMEESSDLTTDDGRVHGVSPSELVDEAQRVAEIVARNDYGLILRDRKRKFGLTSPSFGFTASVLFNMLMYQDKGWNILTQVDSTFHVYFCWPFRVKMDILKALYEISKCAVNTTNSVLQYRDTIKSLSKDFLYNAVFGITSPNTEYINHLIKAICYTFGYIDRIGDSFILNQWSETRDSLMRSRSDYATKITSKIEAFKEAGHYRCINAFNGDGLTNLVGQYIDPMLDCRALTVQQRRKLNVFKDAQARIISNCTYGDVIDYPKEGQFTIPEASGDNLGADGQLSTDSELV